MVITFYSYPARLGNPNPRILDILYRNLASSYPNNIIGLTGGKRYPRIREEKKRKLGNTVKNLEVFNVD